MSTISLQIKQYLEYCEFQKKLNTKTIKAYRTDLSQFAALSPQDADPFSKEHISLYIRTLHQDYKPKSVKRKIASLRAFFNFLEFDEQIIANPMDKIRVEFREPVVLPKALSLKNIRQLLQTAHEMLETEQSAYEHKMSLRNSAVLELLFATGLRVSELCSIGRDEIDLKTGYLKVHGKGSRERVIFISNKETLTALRQYKTAFEDEIYITGWFFVNRLGKKLSEQSVREMIKTYATLAKIPEHVTPHMMRHSFATLMLEEDVDIRYIQSILGHSSISTTQIYTHVSLSKQRQIMRKKHPRNRIFV